MSAQIDTSAVRPDRTGFAVAMIIFGTSTVACFSGPLFMVGLASVMLKENIGIWRVMSAVGGFMGVLLILQPDPSQLDPMLFLPVACGFTYALTQVYTRKHCSRSDYCLART